MSLYEEIIQDINKLKQVAVKTAEEKFINENQKEIQTVVEQLLQEEYDSYGDLKVKGVEEIDVDGEKACEHGEEETCSSCDDPQEVVMNLDALMEEIESLSNGGGDEEINEEDEEDSDGGEEKEVIEESDEESGDDDEVIEECGDDMAQTADLPEGIGAIDINITIKPDPTSDHEAHEAQETPEEERAEHSMAMGGISQDDIYEAILEELAEEGLDDYSGDEEDQEPSYELDHEPVPTGHVGSFTEVERKHEAEIEKAQKYAKEKEDQTVALHETNKRLVSLTRQLKEELTKANLHRAKLLYSNKVLSDNSLNERQKAIFVESIAKATTPKDAKLICETVLRTLMSSKPAHSPKETIQESVSKRSGAILPKRNGEKKSRDPMLTRMQELAGISK